MARNPGRKSKVEEVEEEVEDQEEEQEEGDGEEYEIEAVITYKADAFKDPFEGGYKVKWKGYDEKDNSWVRPTDALGAWDLIEEYWKVRGKKNPHAHLKPPQDEEEDEEMQDVEATPEPEPEAEPPKKRGRPSAAAREAERRKSETKEEPEPKKRGRKSNGAVTVSAPPAKKARRTSSPAAPAKDEVTETVVHPTKLANWKDRADWDKHVIEITTIEHDKEKLYVYFKLKGLKDACSEPLTVCRKRFPEKLLDFYEKNLRWRSVESSDAEDN